MTEFELIRQYFQRDVLPSWCALGVGDDAALIRPPLGRELVLCTDTLIAGRHFPRDTLPADIGWKALAVNLSDLAAMGAQPLGFLLNLTLPDNDEAFVGALAEGLFELASLHEVALIGGDTTRGPLSLTITAFGHVAPGAALRRAAAQPGDVIVIAGELGGAALALQRGDSAVADLRRYLDRPQPQIASGMALAGVAHAAIDVSDGFAADLGHILQASDCGAQIDFDALPIPDAVRALPHDDALRLALHGGDDYALVATVPEPAWQTMEQQHPHLQAIGRIQQGSGLVGRDRHGKLNTIALNGYSHF